MSVSSNKVWRCPWYFIAFGFGLGAMPFAPGTWGTLVGVFFFSLIGHWPLPLYLSVVSGAFIFGVWLCNKVSKDMHVHDAPGIVWDEIVGYLLTMTAIPVNAYYMLFGFILFRLFDILKPHPIRYIDKKVAGGLGIMLDDMLAAIPAWLILYVTVQLFS